MDAKFNFLFVLTSFVTSFFRFADNLEKYARICDFVKHKLTTLEIRRKGRNLIEFYKAVNGLDKVEWKNRLVKTDQGNNDGPASR